jgi:hypothetical protein
MRLSTSSKMTVSEPTVSERGDGRLRGGYALAMSEHEQPQQGDDAPPPAEGEPGREEVAGQRGDQPGYDLDEGAAYEEAADGE